MSFTNSSLISYTRISPNKNSPRDQSITKITIHHMAGVLSLEQFGEIVADPEREMSANYAIGNDGRIGLFCSESDRSWCSSSAWNDNRAVTIEVSNSQNEEPWAISDAAYTSLIKLCADICKRNGIGQLEFTGDQNGSLTYHYMFSATECPGTWIKNHTQEICNKVNAQLKAADEPEGSYTKSLTSGTPIYKEIGKAATGKIITSTIYTIVEEKTVDGIKYGKLKSGEGWVELGKAESGTVITLNAGTAIYAEIGKAATDKITVTTKYTIVEEKVVDNIRYGKLKSGIGWVELENLKRTFNSTSTSDVKELQEALNSKGFSCGDADGIIGNNTINAMFQALCELWLQNK